MIEYTSEASQLRSVFTQFRNSINIYTEDEEKDKKFYKTLFSRLLAGSGIVINDITPLGGCDQVMEACSRDADAHPKLYIVDGDIHLMTTPKTRQDHMYVLERYCIENFLIDDNAVYATYDELDSEHDLERIKELVDFDTMMTQGVTPMVSLFCHFAVSQDVLNVYRLKHVSQIMTGGDIDDNKLKNEKKFVKDDVMSHSGIDADNFDALLADKLSIYDANKDNLLKYVSGKDYLIPYIVAYTKTRLNQSLGVTKEGWKYHFSKHCDLTALNGLKTAIVNEVRSAQNQ